MYHFYVFLFTQKIKKKNRKIFMCWKKTQVMGTNKMHRKKKKKKWKIFHWTKNVEFPPNKPPIFLWYIFTTQHLHFIWNKKRSASCGVNFLFIFYSLDLVVMNIVLFFLLYRTLFDIIILYSNTPSSVVVTINYSKYLSMAKWYFICNN